MGGVDEEEDTGKFKQASGSYQDYFAAKMAALKAQGRFKEVPDWKEEASFGGGQMLGLGAGNGRVVDREIQRESLLCPDYLKAAKGQRGGESEEREASDHEGEQVGEGEGGYGLSYGRSFGGYGGYGRGYYGKREAEAEAAPEAEASYGYGYGRTYGGYGRSYGGYGGYGRSYGGYGRSYGYGYGK